MEIPAQPCMFLGQGVTLSFQLISILMAVDSTATTGRFPQFCSVLSPWILPVESWGGPHPIMGLQASLQAVALERTLWHAQGLPGEFVSKQGTPQHSQGFSSFPSPYRKRSQPCATQEKCPHPSHMGWHSMVTDNLASKNPGDPLKTTEPHLIFITISSVSQLKANLVSWFGNKTWAMIGSKYYLHLWENYNSNVTIIII